MNDYSKEVIVQAIAWWEGVRPLSFTLEDHLANPRINTSTDREKRLAEAVATYLQKGINS
jgi:hypothetical protein